MAHAGLVQDLTSRRCEPTTDSHTRSEKEREWTQFTKLSRLRSQSSRDGDRMDRRMTIHFVDTHEPRIPQTVSVPEFALPQTENNRRHPSVGKILRDRRARGLISHRRLRRPNRSRSPRKQEKRVDEHGASIYVPNCRLPLRPLDDGCPAIVLSALNVAIEPILQCVHAKPPK